MSELVYDFHRGGYVEGGHRSNQPSHDRWLFDDDYDEAQKIATESIKNPALLKAFDQAFAKVSFNKQLCTRIMHYVSGVFSREGNIEWFGSNLLGVHSIRFFDTDRYALFDQVLVVDEDYLTELITNTKTVDPSWNVASDTMNLTVAYVVHRLMPSFNDKDFYKAAVEIVKLLQFKFYSSIYYHFFPKPVDMPAAEATYSQLSLKFDIRRLGNWGAHIEQRAQDFCSKESPHYDNIKKFDQPGLLIRFITDLNTRTKQTVKDYYGVLDRVRRENSRVITQSARVELDGESIIRDKVTAFNTAKQNLFDASYSINNLYKEELARVVLEMVPKASPNALKTLLIYIAQLPLGKKREEIESIMEDTLSHSFDLIVANRINFRDVAALLNRMRALYQAAKASNEYVLSLRKRIEALAKKETHLRDDAALSAVRTALLLYFLVRSLAI